ncbi:MAG: L,D-transpeptidase, partial [Pseudonocardia sp.]|nr:L,D-transpeptidase [Pseudonocardia sp.]
MGEHSRGARSGWRKAAVAAAVVGLGALGTVGPANAGPDIVEGTPCTAVARACVDLDAKLAWLI